MQGGLLVQQVPEGKEDVHGWPRHPGAPAQNYFGELAMFLLEKDSQ